MSIVIPVKSWHRRKLIPFAGAIFVAVTILLPIKTIMAQEKEEKAQKVKQEKTQSTKLWGPYKSGLLMKPYITIGYHVPELFGHNNTASADFFTDLTTFTNFKLGIGLRITSYMGIEVAYDSTGRQYQRFDEATNSQLNTRLTSHSIYLNAVFFSPSIDVKFGTIEFAINIGTMIFVNMEHRISNPSGTTIATPSSSLGPQFMAGFSIIYGFPKLFTIRGFTEIITLSDAPFGIPCILNSGVAINIYLI